MQVMKLETRPTNVVLNDKQKPTAVTKKPKTPPASDGAPTLPAMEAKRQSWEAAAYRTSNKQLYAVLADCLAYSAKLPFEEARHRHAELTKFLEERGYVVKNESPLLTRVVKAVFGNVDRRRISTYSLVLRAAHKEDVKPADLPAWIEARNGVQEVRLGRSATYKSPKERATAGRSMLSTMPTLAVAKDKLCELADADFAGSECVLLAEQQPDGSFHIKSLNRSNAAINAALAALYSQQLKAAA